MATTSILSQNRIGRRLFLQSFIIAAGLTILFSGLQVWLNYQDQLSTVQSSIHQIDQVQMRGISTALWYFSMPELKAQVEGITNFPYINYAEVRDNGKILSRAGVKKDGAVQEKEIPITYLDNGSLNTIGVLYLQINTGAILVDLREEVIRNSFFQAINIWISLFFFLLLVDRQVIRHLNTAARYFRTFDINNYHTPLRLNKRPASDELDALVDAFNQMHQDVIHASEQRHESERKHAVLLSNLPGMAFQSLHDRSRTMQLVSAGSFELTGYKPEALTLNRGMVYSDLIHPDDREAVWQLISHALGEKQEYELTYRIKTLQGQVKWVWEKGIGIFDRESQSQRIEGFVIDITERKQQERELEAIAAMSYALRSARTKAEMLPVIMEQTAQLFYADCGTLELIDPGNGDAVIEMALGESEKLLGQRYAYDQGMNSIIRKTGKPYLHNMVAGDPPDLPPEFARPCGAFAGAPMIANGELIGLLWIGRNTDISENELRTLSEVADIAANAIHRANLFYQTEQRLRQLMSLRKIDAAINSHEDPSVTYDLLLEQAMQLLSVDAAQILLVDPNSKTYHFQMGKGFHSQRFEQLWTPIGERSSDQALLQRVTVRCCDINTTPPDPITLDKMRQEGFSSFFAVPLVMKNEVKGVLRVFLKAPFTPAADWIEFLETLAGQVAIATSQAQLLSDLQRSNWELRMAYDQTIEGWSNALDLRDRETEGHSQRVCALTLKLASLMGLQGEDLVNIRRGALLHDIGKMGVPDHILLKPGELTPEEWSEMYKHPDYAYQLLSPIEYLHPALDIPYCHHEKWDGSGYPRHLKGYEIPLAARIFAVADVWDALTSKRPYRDRLPDAEVLQYIRERAGKQFDPEIVNLFIQTNPVSAD